MVHLANVSSFFGGRPKFAPDGVSGKLNEGFREMFQRLFLRVVSKLVLTSALQVSSCILMVTQKYFSAISLDFWQYVTLCWLSFPREYILFSLEIHEMSLPLTARSQKKRTQLLLPDGSSVQVKMMRELTSCCTHYGSEGEEVEERFAVDLVSSYNHWATIFGTLSF